MRPLLVGMCPVDDEHADLELAFVGTYSGRRLARLVGLDDDRMLPEMFDLANVFPWPELTDAWPAGRARLEARRLVRMQPPGRRIVALGQLVAEAMCLPTSEPFVWQRVPYAPEVDLSTLPHPSGLNRWWNEPVNVMAAGRFLGRLAGFRKRRGCLTCGPEIVRCSGCGMASNHAHLTVSDRQARPDGSVSLCLACLARVRLPLKGGGTPLLEALGVLRRPRS